MNNQLEDYFQAFRDKIIGINHYFQSPYGKQKIIYADWIASGRLYGPIEQKITNILGPYVANTHTEANLTGTAMTLAYRKALRIIKEHVNADANDVILTSGAGMTSAVNKLQRILGLRLPEKYKKYLNIPEDERPVIFVTHMEHHSNHISWTETIGDVVVVPPGEDGRVSAEQLENTVCRYKGRKWKIGSFTACSNVTGIRTPYHQLAKVMHENQGVCFIDFAASAPYEEINMHPQSPIEKLDAIYFSPHKFLGGMCNSNNG